MNKSSMSGGIAKNSCDEILTPQISENKNNTNKDNKKKEEQIMKKEEGRWNMEREEQNLGGRQILKHGGEQNLGRDQIQKPTCKNEWVRVGAGRLLVRLYLEAPRWEFNRDRGKGGRGEGSFARFFNGAPCRFPVHGKP